MDDTNLITIGCRHPSGLRLRVSEWFKTPGLDEPQLREIAVYDLAGSGQHQGVPGNGTLPGYTKIPAEHWEKWKALNGHSDLYASGTLFEAQEGDDAPEAPQLTAEEERERENAEARRLAKEQAQLAADAKAREAEEAKAEADRAARAAADHADQGGLPGGGDGSEEEPAPDAELDKLTDDELRAYVRDRGVIVDGRWGRKKLLVEAEKLKAKG
ncbi:hypothetical protein DA075_10175 [Methylobacterium currus]|uniref:Uncharacterized protein n=1 Tax=Methylobacterium currus TaxID=2051553 RepID=A0A2R4WI64_9HYPH|nr:hypothetical protein [Methylobacterium currus]AWB21233.1 hypothetical protein DA075_10175 [Methylobacterium currus]